MGRNHSAAHIPLSGDRLRFEMVAAQEVAASAHGLWRRKTGGIKWACRPLIRLREVNQGAADLRGDRRPLVRRVHAAQRNTCASKYACEISHRGPLGLAVTA